MNRDKIKVILKVENKKAEVKELSLDVHFLQGYVGGLIDMTSMPNMDGEVDIICNDNFLNNGSKPNVMLPEYNHVMGGNLVFAGYDPMTGDSISLTDKQIEKVMKYIDKNQVKNMDFASAFMLMKAQQRHEAESEL